MNHIINLYYQMLKIMLLGILGFLYFILFELKY